MNDEDILKEAEFNDSAKIVLLALPGYAEMTRKYYLELVDRGFNEKQALYLTGKFMHSFLQVGEDEEQE